tara:strand:- start:4997 stop:6289 length:1293 start_codon:yes stop_codon:yes gene_type:complete
MVNYEIFFLTVFIKFFIYLFIVLKYRFHLIKPSVIILFIIFVRVEIGILLNYDNINNFLVDSDNFFLISFIFPLIALLISISYNNFRFLKFYEVISMKGTHFSKINFKKTEAFLLIILFGIAFFYIYNVSIYNTGLYAIIFDPENSDLARENSFKLLTNTYIIYSFSILSSTVAPLIIAIYAYRLAKTNNKTLDNFFTFFKIIIIVLIVCLPGSRAAASYLALSFFATYWYSKSMRTNLTFVIISLVLITMIPLLLTVLRNDEFINFQSLIFYLNNSIIDRIFIINGTVASWYYDYVSNNGFVGIAGVAKLASLFQIESIDMHNVIGLTYKPHAIESISAGTAFFFAYYSLFGINGIFLSFFCLVLLDFISIFFYSRIDKNFLPIVLGCIFVSLFHIAETNFETILITHGFLPILLISFFLARKKRKNDV